jgi:hypothetical protein
LIAITLISAVVSNAQNKPKTETKIFGNCGMCETKIEKGHKRTSPQWDKDTKMATLIYDSKITKEKS